MVLVPRHMPFKPAGTAREPRAQDLVASAPHTPSLPPSLRAACGGREKASAGIGNRYMMRPTSVFSDAREGCHSALYGRSFSPSWSLSPPPPVIGTEGEADAFGGWEGLVHRFAAAWVRVRAAFGDG